MLVREFRFNLCTVHSSTREKAANTLTRKWCVGTPDVFLLPSFRQMASIMQNGRC
jgi:hypothetical protein